MHNQREPTRIHHKKCIDKERKFCSILNSLLKFTIIWKLWWSAAKEHLFVTTQDSEIMFYVLSALLTEVFHCLFSITIFRQETIYLCVLYRRTSLVYQISSKWQSMNNKHSCMTPILMLSWRMGLIVCMLERENQIGALCLVMQFTRHIIRTYLRFSCQKCTMLLMTEAWARCRMWFNIVIVWWILLDLRRQPDIRVFWQFKIPICFSTFRFETESRPRVSSNVNIHAIQVIVHQLPKLARRYSRILTLQIHFQDGNTS